MQATISTDQLFKAVSQCYGVAPSDYENVKGSFLSSEQDNSLTLESLSDFRSFYKDRKFLNVIDNGKQVQSYLTESYFKSKGTTLYDETAECALEEVSNILFRYLGPDFNLVSVVTEIVDAAPIWLKKRYENHSIYVARAYVTTWLLTREVEYKGLSLRTDTYEAAKAKYEIMEALRKSRCETTPVELAYSLAKSMSYYYGRRKNLWIQARYALDTWVKDNVEVYV